MAQPTNPGLVDPRKMDPVAPDPEINLGAGKRDKNISTVDPKKEVKEPSKENSGGEEEERLPGKDESLH